MVLATYSVADVRGVDGLSAPPEILERFQGRAFTLPELEARGVRIAGMQAWLVALGKDWQLILDPPTSV